jgi:hypothetical protein
VVTLNLMPANTRKDQPGTGEEKPFADESPEDEAQRSARRRDDFEDDTEEAIRLPKIEPEVTEEESKLVEEHDERGESPSRKY